MKNKVYLAGGFKSNWSEKVKQLKGFDFFDPKDKEIKEANRVDWDVNSYGKYDLHYIKMSDIVFVYVEKSNPSCIGLSVEAGFAKGLNKTVILVLEDNHETIKDNYLKFITQVADITFNDFDKALDYLKTFNI